MRSRTERLQFAIACFVMVLVMPSTASAVPVGYELSTTTIESPIEPANLNDFPQIAAIAYGPDNTLYALQVHGFQQGNVGRLHRIASDGTQSYFDITGVDTFGFSPGGMTYDVANNRLLITDNAATANTIYTVDPLTTGGTTILATDLLAPSTYRGVADIAMNHLTGDVFVNDAGNTFAIPNSTVEEVDFGAPSSTVVLSSGNLGTLQNEYGGGIVFDSSGKIVFQTSDEFTFAGDVYRFDPTDPTPSSTVELLASGLNASFRLALDSEDDIFVTGGNFLTGEGGIFELVPDGGGGFTETLFHSPGGAFPFSAAVAFLAGSDPFEPFAGNNGGVMSFVSNSNPNDITHITPIGTVTPEPGTAGLMLFGIAGLMLRVRLSRRRTC